MAGGGGGVVISRATVERESARGQKFTKCGEREHGPEILVRGHNARHAATMRVSLFLVLETRVIVAHHTFYCKGRCTDSGVSYIDSKVRHAPNKRVSF
jgi:hypothetical protein